MHTCGNSEKQVLSWWNTITAVWTGAIDELHGNSIKDFMWLFPHLAACSHRQWDHLRTESLLNTKQMKDWLFISALGRAAASTLSNCKPLGPNKQVITGDKKQSIILFQLMISEVWVWNSQSYLAKSFTQCLLNSSTFMLRGGAVLSLQRPSTPPVPPGLDTQVRTYPLQEKWLIPASKIKLWVAKKRKKILLTWWASLPCL